MTLGPLLKRYRTQKGWSQRELGERAQVRQALISELETGKKTDTQSQIVQRLAEALGIRTAVLLGEDPTPDLRRHPHTPLPWKSVSV